MTASELRWADARILVIDDDRSNARLLSRLLLRTGYRDVHMLTDGRQALDRYRELQPDLVLLDLHMPHVHGLSLLQRMREVSSGHGITPILVITADSSLESRRNAHLFGANDYLVKPYDLSEVTLRVDALLELRAHAQAGFRAVREMRSALDRVLSDRSSEQQVLQRLAVACSFRDGLSEGHTRRVAQLATEIAREMGLPRPVRDAVRQCAPLHDIGKVAIPDEILLKAGPLNAEEMAIAERHTTIGAVILSGSDLPLLGIAAEIARTHHEWWDGQGYPRGLQGEEIPLLGRIVAVADVFDALTHERSYKEAWTVEATLEHIRARRGSQFEPRVVDALLAVIGTVGAAAASRVAA